jgi:mono/diheme cytochrome c family protein
MSVFLLGYRNPDLSLRTKRLPLGLHDDMCEDVPAWWLLKKKRRMYYTGGIDARSVRSLMQFMMVPFNSAATFEREEATFRDIQAYILSLEAPKYPLPIDRSLAQRGELLFRRDCARCHGTYGDEPTYPNKIVPIDEIGTDPKRYQGIEAVFGEYYNTTWFSREQPGWLLDTGAAVETPGYQAPPLDGLWATAPYLHNGSVPTVEGVLNSAARPKIFTRSFRTGREDYDPVRLGWKVTVLEQAPPPSPDPVETRKVYDTTRPGRSNTGHTYGDHLSDEDRRALIEYLKTL